MTNSITGLPGGVEGLSSNRLEQDKKTDKTLGQDAFLELMITQLKNQDPSAPMENGEFLSQMAQFGTVSGINDLQKSFTALATSLQSNQALQASTMVGRKVQIESPKLRLEANGSAAFDVELAVPARALNVVVQDETGATVSRFNHGDIASAKLSLRAGEHELSWDGLAADGKRLPPGLYTVKVTSVDDQAKTGVTTLMQATVDSVTLPRNGQPPVLNVADFGAMNLEDIRRVK